ncbi:alkaline phosphatase family protein [candidate division KSB1 bacterium]|nr:alkaline phosphatase family protein [candidate division KSB1 bacterium]
MRRPFGLEHVVLIFVDGLGVGSFDPCRNPLTQPAFDLLAYFQERPNPSPVGEGGLAFAVDTTLGIPGLPQSATGQTALLTGVNAAQHLGRHLSGFPNRRLRLLIEQYSIFRQLRQRGCRAAFLNTFRPPFFDHNPHDILRYLSATTLSNLYADLAFFDLDDLLAGRSIYQDITNESLRQKGFDVPLFSPEKAGKIVARQAREYDFVLFEFFQTDRAGHSQNFESARRELLKLERFLGALLAESRLQDTLIIVTSDHGNIEDLSRKTHTENPALTLLFGPGRADLHASLTDLTDFVPLILALCCH